MGIHGNNLQPGWGPEHDLPVVFEDIQGEPPPVMLVYKPHGLVRHIPQKPTHVPKVMCVNLAVGLTLELK